MALQKRRRVGTEGLSMSSLTISIPSCNEDSESPNTGQLAGDGGGMGVAEWEFLGLFSAGFTWRMTTNSPQQGRVIVAYSWVNGPALASQQPRRWRHRRPGHLRRRGPAREVEGRSRVKGWRRRRGFETGRPGCRLLFWRLLVYMIEAALLFEAYAVYAASLEIIL